MNEGLFTTLQPLKADCRDRPTKPPKAEPLIGSTNQPFEIAFAGSMERLVSDIALSPLNGFV